LFTVNAEDQEHFAMRGCHVLFSDPANTPWFPHLRSMGYAFRFLKNQDSEREHKISETQLESAL